MSGAQVPSPASDRILQWEGCFNVRDLGGLWTADGRRIRWGAIVRSDIPTRLTEAGRRALLDHGISSIVDLRFTDEVTLDGDLYPFRAVADQPADQSHPRYVNVPFHVWNDADPDDERLARYRAATTRAELNRLDLDLSAPGIGAAVAAIADAPVGGGVLVHCHGGKDRTGIVVALILALVGVSDEDIADDYALTTLNLEPLIIEWLDETSSDPAERDRLRALATPAREAMLDTLAYLRDKHGSAESFLRTAGVTEEQFARLRARLLEEA